MRPLPLYRDINFMFHDPVETGHYTDFDELGMMKVNCGIRCWLLLGLVKVRKVTCGIKCKESGFIITFPPPCGKCRA